MLRYVNELLKYKCVFEIINCGIKTGVYDLEQGVFIRPLGFNQDKMRVIIIDIILSSTTQIKFSVKSSHWRIGTLKYLEIKIEEWPSSAN